MNKNILLISIAFMHLQLQLNANVFTVSNGQDSGTNSFRSAIIETNSTFGHDTIIVDNTVSTILLTTAQDSAQNILDFIRDTLTIFGNGVTMEAKVAGRFLVFTNHVIVKDMTFKNAFIKGSGAAIFQTGKSAVMINCRFINNTVTIASVVFAFGGAIHMNDGHMSLHNCEFINNSSSRFGGAINLRQGTVDIVNCTFLNNSAGIDGQSIYQNFGGVGSPGVINIYSGSFESPANEPDIVFRDGNVILHQGYELLANNTIWITDN